MRVLMITKLFSPHRGGIEVHVAGLSKYLTRRGHQVEVLTSRYSKEVPPKSCFDGFTVTRARDIAAALLHVVRSDVDVVHMHDYATSLTAIGAMARLIRPKSLVWTPHGIYPLRKGWARLRRIAFDCTAGRLICRASDAVIALTEENRKQLEAMEVDPSRITVIPNGIDFERLHSPKSHGFRSQLGLEGPVVLCVGRLDWNKGLAYAVDALRTVTTRWPDCKLVLVGKDHGIGNRLRSRARDLGISSSLLVVGEIPDEDVAQAYVESDLFVLPSLYEGLPTVVLEAMASGLPVIATKTGAPDVIRNMENGMLVNYGDSRGLALAILTLLQDTKLRSRLVEAGRATVKNFDWTSVAESIEAVYVRLSEKGQLCCGL